MELYLFTLLCFISILFIFKIKNNSSLIRVILYVLISAYLFTVRLTPHDDLITYIPTFSESSPVLFGNIYYLREIVFWGVGNLLTNVVFGGNAFYSLIIFDLIALLIVFKTCKLLNLPLYYILLVYLSFPGVFGAQNILRQFYASVLLIYSLALYKNKKVYMAFMLFLLSVLIHNAVALFLPLFFIYNRNVFLYYMSSIAGVFLMIFLRGSKSNSSSGLSLLLVYILVLFILAVYFYLIKNKNILFKTSLHVSLYVLILTSVCALVLGEAQAERMGMIAIQVVIPSVCLSLDAMFKPRELARTIFVVIFILPSFLFSSSFDMITNEKDVIWIDRDYGFNLLD